MIYVEWPWPLLVQQGDIRKPETIVHITHYRLTDDINKLIHFFMCWHENDMFVQHSFKLHWKWLLDHWSLRHIWLGLTKLFQKWRLNDHFIFVGRYYCQTGLDVTCNSFRFIRWAYCPLETHIWWVSNTMAIWSSTNQCFNYWSPHK